MKFQVTILAILFFSTINTVTISPGCISILTNVGVKECSVCYRRKFQKEGVCGPLQPASDPCDQYIYDEHKGQICVQCKTGYALLETFSSNSIPTTVCKKAIIQGCAIENIESTTRHHYCFACENDKYIKFTPGYKSSYCVSVTNPVPHCKWGSRLSDSHADGHTCAKCQPGYAVDLVSAKCQPALVPGCTQQAKGKCYFCDGVNGYFMNAQKTCYKAGGAETA